MPTDNGKNNSNAREQIIIITITHKCAIYLPHNAPPPCTTSANALWKIITWCLGRIINGDMFPQNMGVEKTNAVWPAKSYASF